jgi:hypothetical protein
LVKKAGLFFSLALWGITGAMPRVCAAARLALLEIALVAQRGAWGDVRPDIEQDLETGCVRDLSAGQIERDDVARIVRLGMDFRREPAARAAERLALLPPLHQPPRRGHGRW